MRTREISGFAVDKHLVTQVESLHDALLRDMVSFLIERRDEFAEYDKIKIYYGISIDPEVDLSHLIVL